MAKVFKIDKKHIRRIAPGFGGCVASDRIVVDGCEVGYMYREEPCNPLDSGWRFLAGDEDAEYMADLEKHGVYDVNTIANYDRSIIPLLEAEIGSKFEKIVEKMCYGQFRQID